MSQTKIFKWKCSFSQSKVIMETGLNCQAKLGQKEPSISWVDSWYSRWLAGAPKESQGRCLGSVAEQIYGNHVLFKDCVETSHWCRNGLVVWFSLTVLIQVSSYIGLVMYLMVLWGGAPVPRLLRHGTHSWSPFYGSRTCPATPRWQPGMKKAISSHQPSFLGRPQQY